MIKNFLKKNWLNIIVILAFVVSAFYVAQYHELWSDEAQSWLIARDSSVPEIFGYIRNEGTPPLWVLIIKLFMFFGITYDTYYIIPIIFMTLGLIFMYTKFDIPWYLKVLFPFTYFVFFQTTIVVRSYSLILLGIVMVFYYFPQRYEKMWKFYFAMLYFMSISLHTFFVAGSFYAIMLLYLIQDFKDLDSKTKKHMIAVSCVLFMTFLALLIVIFPTASVGFGGNGGRSFFYIIGESTYADTNKIEQVVSTIAVCAISLYVVYKNYKACEDRQKAIREFENLFIVVPLIAMSLFIHCQVRYLAIMYFIIVLYFIKNKQYTVVKVALVVMFAVQIVWNVSCCSFDHNNQYAVGRDIANFIKEIGYKDKQIDTINFHVVEISPYFDENIFYHSYKTNKAFYCWSLDSEYLNSEQLVESNADIYVIPILNGETVNGETKAIYSINVLEFMENVDYSKYHVYSYKAQIPQKKQINENDTFLIYVNDRVENEIKEKNIQIEKETRRFLVKNMDTDEYETLDFSKF